MRLPLSLAVPLPAHFVASVGGASIASFDNTPVSNPITDAGATLGRVLFYDSRLSRTDATSCASCHRQSLGFADALPRSVGITGALTPRHATGLANARFYGSGRFFWDERAASLEAQVLEPIQHRDEMGMSLDSLALKLAVTPYYPAVRGGVRIPVDHERPRRRGAGAVRSRHGVGRVAL
jgi:cytochrome c peroxidase